MEIVDIRSSSNELSSAPVSDAEGPTSHSLLDTSVISVAGRNVGAASSALANGSAAARQDQQSVKRKRRTKKEIEEANALKAERKEKLGRKPRASTDSKATSRKKVKTETGIATPNLPVLSQPPTLGASTTHHPIQAALTAAPNIEAAKTSQNGLSSSGSTMLTQVQAPYTTTTSLPMTQPPPQQKTRAMFDPVRGLNTERISESYSQPKPTTSPIVSTPPRSTFIPSASPSISSIINPTDDTISISRSSAIFKPEPEAPITSLVVGNVKPDPSSVMDVDQQEGPAAKASTPETAAPKPAPKPRAKEQPPPLPTGSGLLSSSLFGGDTGPDSRQDSSDRGPNIVLHIDIKNPNNKVINFARLAEDKYGFAALYPRQAAQKERLAKVAAAGAALERAALGKKGGTSAGDSADEDASVDIDRDSDNDGDVAMSGVNGTGDAVNSGTDGAGPGPRRRKRKDEYDADDPFVDDSEMLWEAQAAASKDGFFVYCGPLVPEGEKPAVERADGTMKRGRGRGRGGGPGSRGGRGGGAAAARDPEGTGGRGGGTSVMRGTGATRKPRGSKADKTQRDVEKKNREQTTSLAAKPAVA